MCCSSGHVTAAWRVWRASAACGTERAGHEAQADAITTPFEDDEAAPGALQAVRMVPQAQAAAEACLRLQVELERAVHMQSREAEAAREVAARRADGLPKLWGGFKWPAGMARPAELQAALSARMAEMAACLDGPRVAFTAAYTRFCGFLGIPPQVRPHAGMAYGMAWHRHDAVCSTASAPHSVQRSCQ